MKSTNRATCIKRLESDLRLTEKTSTLDCLVLFAPQHIQGLALSTPLSLVLRMLMRDLDPRPAQTIDHWKNVFGEQSEEDTFVNRALALQLTCWSYLRECIEFENISALTDLRAAGCETDIRKTAGLSVYLFLEDAKLDKNLRGLFIRSYLDRRLDRLDVFMMADFDANFDSVEQWETCCIQATKILTFENVSQNFGFGILNRKPDSKNDSPLDPFVINTLLFLGSDLPEAVRWRKMYQQRLREKFNCPHPFAYENFEKKIHAQTFTESALRCAKIKTEPLKRFEIAHLTRIHEENAIFLEKSDLEEELFDVGNRLDNWEHSINDFVRFTHNHADADPNCSSFAIYAFFRAAKYRLQEERSRHPRQASLGLLVRMLDIIYFLSLLRHCETTSDYGYLPKFSLKKDLINDNEDLKFIVSLLEKTPYRYLTEFRIPFFSRRDWDCIESIASHLASSFQSDFNDFPQDVLLNAEDTTKLLEGLVVCLMQTPSKLRSETNNFMRVLKKSAVLMAQAFANGALTIESSWQLLRLLHDKNTTTKTGQSIRVAKALLMARMKDYYDKRSDAI